MAGLLPFTTVQNPQPIAGRFMFVDYGVAGEPWHERWVFEVLENRHAVIVTPDHEVYVEVMQVDKRCFRNMRICAAGARALPSDLGDNKGQPVYRFKSAIMPHSVVAKAKRLYDKEKAKPHLPIGEDDDEEAEEAPLPPPTGAPGSGAPAPPDPGRTYAEAMVAANSRTGGRWIIVGGSLGPERCGEPAVFADEVKFARFDADSGYMLSMDDSVQLVEFWADAEFNDLARRRRDAFREADGEKTPTGKKQEEDESEDARTLPVLWSANG